MRTLKSFCKSCSNKVLCITLKRKKCVNTFRCITCGTRYYNDYKKGLINDCRERIGRRPGDVKISPCKDYTPRHWKK